MDNFNIIVGKSTCTPDVVQVNNFSVSIGSKKLFIDSELVLSAGHIYGLIGICLIVTGVIMVNYLGRAG